MKRSSLAYVNARHDYSVFERFWDFLLKQFWGGRNAKPPTFRYEGCLSLRWIATVNVK